MSEHDRFNEEHRRVCSDCYSAYLDFLQEQQENALLDALAELNERVEQ